jgi:hypothetical protein
LLKSTHPLQFYTPQTLLYSPSNDTSYCPWLRRGLSIVDSTLAAPHHSHHNPRSRTTPIDLGAPPHRIRLYLYGREKGDERTKQFQCLKGTQWVHRPWRDNSARSSVRAKFATLPPSGISAKALISCSSLMEEDRSRMSKKKVLQVDTEILCDPKNRFL